MSNSNKTYSKAAVTGFILAVAPVAIFLLIEFLDLFIHIHSMGFNQIYAYSVIVCGVLSILIGSILSIAGLVSCNRNNLKGKGLAVTALIFFSIEELIAVMAVFVAVKTYAGI